MLNSDFDHMFGLANGFCDQKPERSKMNWPNNSGPCDWISTILDSLESSHRGESESDVSFIVSALVKNFFNTQISYNI